MNMQETKMSKRGIGRHSLCFYVLLSCALAFAGCTKQQQKAITGPISIPDADKAQIMEIAEDVLARMHFTIDKADVPTGLIRTRPLAGAQFFEFWRSDNVGSENSLQANLHTIRRTAELNVTARDGQLEIDCDVRVQRLCLPEREVAGTTRAYGMHTRSSPTLQKLSFDAGQAKGVAWIDLDDDAELAAEILRRIEKRIALRADNKSQTTENQT